MKLTIIGENFYDIEEFQKFFRWWVKQHEEKLMISFDCCPISLFMLFYHLKYDDKHHIKYLLTKYMPSYYQTYQIAKFIIKNFKRIRKGNIILFSTYTYITENIEILDEFSSIVKSQKPSDFYNETMPAAPLDEIDKAMIQNCEMIRTFLKTYKTEEKTIWDAYNDYQKQSSFIMSKFSQTLAKENYHLVIYTNILNAYIDDLNIDGKIINYKSLVRHWVDRFRMDIIYLLGKEGEYINMVDNQTKKIQYKPKHFVYLENEIKFIPFPKKNANAQIDYLIFKNISTADHLVYKLTYEPPK
jgi:hypothetical protein